MQFSELQDSPCSAVKTFKTCINREFMGEASAKAALKINSFNKLRKSSYRE